MYLVGIEDHFSAAHRLREYDGDCEHLHGHNWKVRAVFRSEKLNSRGLSIDFRTAKRLLSNILVKFDHVFLNDLNEFQDRNPSCENIAEIIFDELAGKLRDMSPDNDDVTLAEVTVWESPTSSVTVRKGASES